MSWQEVPRVLTTDLLLGGSDAAPLNKGVTTLEKNVAALALRNWFQRSESDTVPLLGVHYDGSGLWCAVGGTGKIQTSTDSITWTSRTADATYTGDFLAVAHDGALWCAVGQSGEIQTSPDGETWTSRTADATYTGAFRAVAHDGALWCAVGESGEIQTSPDGETWTRRLTGGDNIIGIAHDGDGLWCAVGSDGILTSADAITWTPRTPDASYSSTAYSVAHDGDGLWCLVGESGEIQTSPDGETWTRRRTNEDDTLQAVCYSVALGYWCCLGAGVILISKDGINWVTAPCPLGASPRYVASSPGVLVAVGSNNLVLTTLFV